MLHSLHDLSSLTRKQTWAPAVTVLNPNPGTSKEFVEIFVSFTDILKYLDSPWHIADAQ